MGRFLNADGYVSTGQGILGNNMYAYCGNNPVMYVDHGGEWFLSFLFGILAAGLALFGLSSCSAETVKEAYDGYDNIKSNIELGENIVEFAENTQKYKSYVYSYSYAAAQYNLDNSKEIYWDENLSYIFYDNIEEYQSFLILDASFATNQI